MAETDPPKAWRRTILQAGAAILAGRAVAGRAAAQAPDRVAKSMVAYQDAPHPNGQKCSACVAFQPPNACAVVAGTISPNGWCGAFTPKPT
jgi:hypothetical protein